MDLQSTIALVWLLILALIAIVYVALQAYRNEYSAWENCLYVPTFLMGRLVWRVRFKNDPPPEIQAGAVLVANHRSSVDPFFVQLAARRRVHWMVAKEFCTHFLFGPILRAVQVIPTNRSGMDTASTKQAIRITNEGRLVGMFPEGKINTGKDVLLPLRGGAAVVAIRGNAPMIPLLIEGSPYSKQVWAPVFMPSQVTITFGEAVLPIHKSDTEDEQDTRQSDTVESDRMMLEVGRQILRLAGQSGEIELASARKRKKKNRTDS